MRIVIVGASLAGVRAARSARAAGFDGEILLLGAESQLPYERPPLSKELLLGDASPLAPVLIEPSGFYESNEIAIELGARAVRLDTPRREVNVEDGRRWHWDRLLVATGADPRRLDVPGAALEGVVTLRYHADALDLRSRLLEAERVVVIGAGLVGLEVASAAAQLGKHVTLVERSDGALSRVAHPRVGREISALLARGGIAWRPNAVVARVAGGRRVSAVILEGGESVPADVVVVAIGTVASTQWLDGSGLRISDGVEVDEACRTNVPDVLAAGDVANIWIPRLHRRFRVEQYGAAAEQGTVAGLVAAGKGATATVRPGAGTSVFGTRLQFAGASLPTDQVVLRGAPESGRFSAFSLRDGRVVAAASVGRPREMLAVRGWLPHEPAIRPELLMDESIDLATLEPGERAAG